MKGYYVYQIGPPLALLGVIGPLAHGAADAMFFGDGYLVTSGYVDAAVVNTSGWRTGQTVPGGTHAPDGNQRQVTSNASAGASSLAVRDDGTSPTAVFVPMFVAGTNSGFARLDRYGVTGVSRVGGVATLTLSKPLARSLTTGDVVGIN